MIIAIQGGMAVGKTIALKIIEKVYSKIAISFVDISPVVDKINKHQLDNNKLDDYCEIQQLFIQHERDRYELVRDNEIVLMDYGAEEIAFYTQYFPKVAGYSWTLPSNLLLEVNRLKECFADYIIFLDADETVLYQRQKNDFNRRRHFFKWYTHHLLPAKKHYLDTFSNVIHINTNHLNAEEVAEKIIDIIRKLTL